MRALVLREHGGGGLRLETGFPDPVPGEGDVVLRVRATSLNYHDVFTRRGMPGIRIAMPAIMGLDVAGVSKCETIQARRDQRPRALVLDRSIPVENSRK